MTAQFLAEAKRINRVSMAAMYVAGMIFLYVVYLSVFPLKVADVESPLPVISHEVEQGGMLKFNFSFCVYDDSPADFHQILRGETVFPLGQIGSVKPGKGCKSEIVSVHIPDFIPPGQYVYEVDAVHKVNMMREITVSFYTEPFLVIERKKD